MQPPSDPLEQRYGTFAAVLDELQRIRTLSAALDGTRESIERVVGAVMQVTETVEASRDEVQESVATTTGKAEVLFEAQRVAIARAQEVHQALVALADSLATSGLTASLEQLAADQKLRFDGLDQHHDRLEGLLASDGTSVLDVARELNSQSRALAGKVQTLEQLVHNSHSLLGHLADGHRQHVQLQTERSDALNHVLSTHRTALEGLGKGVGGIASTLKSANLAERVDNVSRLVSSLQGETAAFQKKSEARSGTMWILMIATLAVSFITLMVTLGLLRLQMTS